MRRCIGPLFIPLKAVYFDAFDAGTKTRELRLYGPRWNERTCFAGRPAVLSKGYGKHHRLTAIVTGFAVLVPAELTPTELADFIALYGASAVHAAVIQLTLTNRTKKDKSQ